MNLADKIAAVVFLMLTGSVFGFFGGYSFANSQQPVVEQQLPSDPFAQPKREDVDMINWYLALNNCAVSTLEDSKETLNREQQGEMIRLCMDFAYQSAYYLENAKNELPQ